MKNAITSFFIIISFLLALIPAAFASIGVEPVIVSLSVKSLRDDVRVVNNGKKIVYVQVSTSRIENPGTKNRKAIPIKNPRESGLLVSPQKLAIPPGQFRLVRIVAIKPNITSDKIFQITFMPIVGKIKQPSNVYNETRMALKFVVGYGVIVLVRPAQLNPKITLSRQGRSVTAKNEGNTTIYLSGGQQCLTIGQCEPLKNLAKRLYPGNTWSFALPKASPVYFFGRYNGAGSTTYRSN